ncbi:MAG: DUF448 domain-containing protein [Pseudomonadota bacterium]
MTGASGTDETLVRFVLSPDGVVTPDFSAKLPGRGAWVTASHEAVAKAAEKRLFSRAFKTEATAPEDLPDIVACGFRRGALSALGLARKAGDGLTGFEKVRAALKRSDLGAVAIASDCGADGPKKLRASLGDAAMVAVFTREELSSAVGTETAYVGLKIGAHAARFMAAADRLQKFIALPVKGDEK